MYRFYINKSVCHKVSAASVFLYYDVHVCYMHHLAVDVTNRMVFVITPYTRGMMEYTNSCLIRFRAIYGVRGSISLHQNLRKNARRASGSRFSLHQKLANSFRVGIASVNRAVMPDLLRIFCNIACLERLYNQPMVASPPSVTIST